LNVADMSGLRSDFSPKKKLSVQIDRSTNGGKGPALLSTRKKVTPNRPEGQTLRNKRGNSARSAGEKKPRHASEYHTLGA